MATCSSFSRPALSRDATSPRQPAASVASTRHSATSSPRRLRVGRMRWAQLSKPSPSSSPAARARGSSSSRHHSPEATAQPATNEADAASLRRPPGLPDPSQAASGAADQFRARLAPTATTAFPTTSASSTRRHSTALGWPQSRRSEPPREIPRTAIRRRPAAPRRISPVNGKRGSGTNGMGSSSTPPPSSARSSRSSSRSRLAGYKRRLGCRSATCR